jgi:hypothetical protein
VPGSCHSSCNHPKVADDNPMAKLMAIFASVGRIGPVVSPNVLNMKVKLNSHGVKNGWCNFPFDFDPVWVDECEGFEARGPQVLKGKNES